MVIAGAGGHALEAFDVLSEMGYSAESIIFYDDFSDKTILINRPVIKVRSKLRQYFIENGSEFCLGVGNPELREKLYHLFQKLGGIHVPIISPRAYISENCLNKGADIMAFCFISSKTELGKCALINTRANIHHEVTVGDFTEISPSSNILGNVQIGRYCKIGANSTILPSVALVDKVTTGAGSVLTKSVNVSKTVKGIPAKE